MQRPRAWIAALVILLSAILASSATSSAFSQLAAPTALAGPLVDVTAASVNGVASTSGSTHLSKNTSTFTRNQIIPNSENDANIALAGRVYAVKDTETGTTITPLAGTVYLLTDMQWERYKEGRTTVGEFSCGPTQFYDCLTKDTLSDGSFSIDRSEILLHEAEVLHLIFHHINQQQVDVVTWWTFKYAYRRTSQQIYVYLDRDLWMNFNNYPEGGSREFNIRDKAKQLFVLEPPHDVTGEKITASNQPILLIHGHNGTDGYWGQIPYQLLERNYDPWQFYYEDTESLRFSAALLREAIDTVLLYYGVDRKVDLVAHSEGTQVAQVYVQSLAIPGDASVYQDPINPDRFIDTSPATWDYTQLRHVRKVVMIGAPNHGLVGPNIVLEGMREKYYRDYLVCEWFLDHIFLPGYDRWEPAVRQLAMGSKLMWDLASASLPDLDGYSSTQIEDEYLVIHGISNEECGCEGVQGDDGDLYISVSSASLLDYGVPLVTVDRDHGEEVGQPPQCSSNNDTEPIVRIIDKFLSPVNGAPYYKDPEVVHYVVPGTLSDTAAKAGFTRGSVMLKFSEEQPYMAMSLQVPDGPSTPEGSLQPNYNRTGAQTIPPGPIIYFYYNTDPTSAEPYPFGQTVPTNGGESKGYTIVGLPGDQRVTIYPAQTVAKEIVAALDPVLNVSPDILNFSTIEEGNTATLPFYITNSGGGTLHWTTSENPDQSWMTLYLTSDSNTGEQDRVDVTVNTTGLTPGDVKTGRITVTSNGGSANIDVTVEIGGNQAPSLDYGRVDPPDGNTADNTTFTYSIRYLDRDNDPPTKKSIFIDGNEYSMSTTDTQYDNGSIFTLTHTAQQLGVDNHFFSFRFEDGNGHSVRYPPSGSILGPTVASGEPWMYVYEPDGVDDLLIATASPTYYTIKWTATDPDNDPLSIDLYYSATKDTNSLNPIVSNLPNTGSYDWDVSLIPEGSYWIYGVSSDGQGQSDDDWSTGQVTISHSDRPPSTKTWIAAQQISTQGVNPSIALGPNNSVHVVWEDGGIYYNNSQDGGLTWGQPKQISNASSSVWEPEVAVDSNGAVHIVWSELQEAYNREIYYKKLDSNGNTIIDNLRLTNASNHGFEPDISVDPNDIVHVIWSDTRNTVSGGAVRREIFYKRSTDGGNNWSGDQMIAGNPAGTMYLGPSIASDANNVYVVYYSDSAEENEFIYFLKSTNSGVSWTSPTRIDQGGAVRGYAYDPRIVVDSNGLHVVFRKGSPANIAYKRSTDGGHSWTDDRLITSSGDQYFPDIATNNNGLYVVSQGGSIPGEFLESLDGGLTWSLADSNVVGDGDLPRIEADANGVHIVWQGSILYRRTVTQNQPPSIVVTSPPAEGASADSSHTIEWTGDDPDGDTLMVDLYYDVDMDTANKNVIATDVPNSGSYLWDTSNIPAGEYYVYATINDGSQSTSDYSEGKLKINHSPSITVTEPDGTDDVAHTFYTILWSGADPDAGDTLTATLYYDTDLDPGSKTVISSTLANTGSYVWDTSSLAEGSYYIYAEITDGVNPAVGDYSAGPLTIDHPNIPPAFRDLPDQVLWEDDTLLDAFDLGNYASDYETLVSELVYTILANTAPDCGVSIDSNNNVDIQPAINWHGSCDVTIQASDGEDTADASFRVTVHPVNDFPWISPSVPDQSNDQNQPIVIDLTSYENDIEDSGPALDWHVTGADDCIVTGEYSDDDVLTFTPNADFVGDDYVTLHLRDSSRAEDSQQIKLTWNPISEVELYYDDGAADGGWATGPFGGACVIFTPPSTPWLLSKIKAAAWYQYGDAPFYVEIWYNNRNELFRGTNQYSDFFSSSVQWAEIDIPDVTVTDDFYVCLFPNDESEQHILWVGLDDDPPIDERSYDARYDNNNIELGPHTDWDWLIRAKGRSENLLQNPGFEQQLTGWNISSGSATYTVDSQVVHSGTQSVKGVEIDSSSLGRLYHDVTSKTQAGKKYRINGWIKTENVDGQVVIALDYVDGNGWAPADGYVKEIGFASGTSDWTYYESDDFTLPGMPVDASALWFLLDFNAGTGTAYWDDLTLMETPACMTGGDVTRNGSVDVDDVEKIAFYWRSYSGDSRYNPMYDLNHDNKINIVDLQVAVLHWGKICGMTDTNIVPNPSFEEGKSLPDGWQPTSSSATYIWDDAVAYSGSRSLGISQPTEAWTIHAWETINLIDVDPSKSYELSVWYLWNDSPDYLEDAEVGIDEYDADGNWVGGSGWALNNTEVGSWQHAQLSMAGRLHAETAKVRISLQRIYRESTSSNATVWFDDISMNQSSQ